MTLRVVCEFGVSAICVISTAEGAARLSAATKLIARLVAAIRTGSDSDLAGAFLDYIDV